MFPLIEPQELHDLMQAQNNQSMIIIDATCASVIPGLSPYQAYQAKHIQDACYFDIDDIADPRAELPHTIPSPELFAQKVTELGVSNDSHVIIYDQTGIAFAAARAWWMFRLFGHDNVQILNGGLPAWEAEEFSTTNEPHKEKNVSTSFKSNFRSHLLKGMSAVLGETTNEQCLILDARSPDRFAGATPESRGFVGSGHIPSSQNQFFMELIDQNSKKMKSKEELERILLPYKQYDSITCTCGGGVTACVLALGLFITGYKDASVYDGSWAEWGNKNNKMPIETAA